MISREGPGAMGKLSSFPSIALHLSKATHKRSDRGKRGERKGVSSYKEGHREGKVAVGSVIHARTAVMTEFEQASEKGNKSLERPKDTWVACRRWINIGVRGTAVEIRHYRTTSLVLEPVLMLMLMLMKTML